MGFGELFNYLNLVLPMLAFTARMLAFTARMLVLV